MTRERTHHLVATITLVAAIVAGGVCWMLEGTAFWAMSGVAMVLLVVGV
jgi:membrane protein YdbS with pleckstrin-like domain